MHIFEDVIDATEWRPLADEEAERFQAQLGNEVGLRHVLYGMTLRLRAIARDRIRDDFVFQDSGQPEVFYYIHLTFRPGTEWRSEFPSTEVMRLSDLPVELRDRCIGIG